MNITKIGKLITKMAAKKNTTKPFTVIVEGNIGCGKTTFLDHFRQNEDVCVLAEPIDMWRNCNGNNLLGLMYQDIHKWSFSFQSYVLLSMVQQHTLPTPKPIKLMERSMFSARYCFIEKMKEDSLIPEPSAAVLDEWFKWFSENTDINVDLIVYLRSTPEVVHERMLIRNRTEEKSVSIDYLRDLHDIHERWLYYKTTGQCPAPVVVLNADLDRSNIIREYKKYESTILNRIAVEAQV